jgi:hypothetical protein
MKQLERLLFLQGGRCFFCAQIIPAGEASVEHLVATANGGAKDDDNCVVCCKAVNAALGSLSIKTKLQVVINQRGAFACPHGTRDEADLAAPVDTGSQLLDDRLALVIGDLIKRGPSRPRRLATLKNTMNSVFQMQLSEQELESLLSELQSRGHVVVLETKVSYALPPQDA